ncbi:MAG TPA: CHRD domain-containing protein [Usitatibacter sp.]|nr:CHRD domain-containing protein [Usitatibacter sp.]
MKTFSRKRSFAMALAVALSAVAGCKSTSTAPPAPASEAATPAVAAVTQLVALSGANEVPPVNTPATATGSVTINADRTVSARIVASGMTATAAHIHLGAAGTNGPVIVPFTQTLDNTFIADGTPRLTVEQYAAFKAGNTYVNVHSDAHKSGEIPAQLKGN